MYQEDGIARQQKKEKKKNYQVTHCDLIVVLRGKSVLQINTMLKEQSCARGGELTYQS